MTKIIKIGFICVCFILLTVMVTASPALGWSEANPKTNFSPRYDFGTAVFNEKLWVIGGDTVNGSVNDVWSSSDGINWTLEKEHAEFSPRHGQGAFVFNDKLWIVGGISNDSAMNDIWSSQDGKNWTEIKNTPRFSPRYHQGAVVFNNKIWIIGGSGQNRYTLNDVWSSSDGENWNMENGHAGFTPRSQAGVAVFNNRLWVIGGYTYSTEIRGDTSVGNVRDVWSSPDGIHWQIENSTPAFEPRESVPLTVFNNRLWILGGGGPEPMKHYFNESYIFSNIWSSPDGKNWSLENENSGFSPRFGSGVAVYNDTLWVIGGRDDNNQDNAEMWRMDPPNQIPTQSPSIPYTPSRPPATPINIPSATNAGIDPMFMLIGVVAGIGLVMKVQKKK